MVPRPKRIGWPSRSGSALHVITDKKEWTLFGRYIICLTCACCFQRRRCLRMLPRQLTEVFVWLLKVYPFIFTTMRLLMATTFFCQRPCHD